MSENEGIKGKEFALRAVVVAAAAILVLFFAKMWIIDPLVSAPAAPVIAEVPQEKANIPAKSWDKTKVKIDWKNAAEYLDRYVETEGVIVSSYRGEKVCYLNFDKNYKETLSLVIFTSNINRFPGSPEKYYLNKKVRVEGRVKDYKGRIEIVLGSQEQIKVLE